MAISPKKNRYALKYRATTTQKKKKMMLSFLEKHFELKYQYSDRVFLL